MEFSDYDDGFRRGVFDKCNGLPRKVMPDEFHTIWDSGYCDGWDGNEVQIPADEIVPTGSTFDTPDDERKTLLHFVSTERIGEVEGMFSNDGTLLGIWSNNDASWRNEYFSPFMEELGFKIVTHWQGDWEEKLIEAAKEYWGLSDFDVDPPY
jgi:hypothetical protein